jgi:hypothetical protein
MNQDREVTREELHQLVWSNQREHRVRGQGCGINGNQLTKQASWLSGFFGIVNLGRYEEDRGDHQTLQVGPRQGSLD